MEKAEENMKSKQDIQSHRNANMRAHRHVKGPKKQKLNSQLFRIKHVNARLSVIENDIQYLETLPE